jgi:hypothetical protein
MLPTRTDLQAYLRIETDAEDALLAELVSEATGWAESLVDRPLVAVSRSFVDPAETNVAYGVVTQLLIPVTPVALDPAPVVTDGDGETVSASTYRVDGATGLLTANRGEAFGSGPYTIVATVGLPAASDYSTRIEPQLRALILGLAALLYHQRNPGARSEGTGGGASVAYGGDEVPPHLAAIARRLSPVGVV